MVLLAQKGIFHLKTGGCALLKNPDCLQAPRRRLVAAAGVLFDCPTIETTA